MNVDAKAYRSSGRCSIVRPDRVLTHDRLGRQLTGGWHLRLGFLRRYGQIAALPDLPPRAGQAEPEEPVVAVTLVRLKLPELPRFLHWGKPVERLVANHPGAIFATAAIRHRERSPPSSSGARSAR